MRALTLSVLAAYRGRTRLDVYVALDDGWIVNGYRRAVRAYVWCG